ncbi:MAG: fibronectin type III domain-containing protein, partial [Tannerella sp.]|nr:fibronectin type III domain-containing protein [Tannerella sp.]
TFQVRALNAAGHGAATPAVAATPLAVPAAPQALAAAPGDAQVALSWGAPTDDGGTPVTGYKVSSDGTTWYTEPGTGYTFAGLTNGASYTFHVRAVNAVGEGPSATVPATLDSYGVTLAPAAAYAFPSATYGYGDDADADDDGAAPAPLTVTVANSGTLPTGALVVAVTGIGPDTFLLSRAALGSIPVAGSDTFSLAPAAGLAAGTYTATVTVSGGDGISADLSVSFTVDRAEPTVDALGFDLSDVVYAGKPLSVAVGAADGIAGLGEVTVKYNGFTRRPVEPGTYTVTVDIAAGANYEGVTGLLLGTLTVAVPPYPVPLLRTVTLPPFAEATTVPAAGQHAVASGEDFEFILFSAASLAGSEPAVTVDRSVAGETGVACTPNGDGSYTVLIHAVRQDLAVGVTFVDPSAGTDVVAGGGIWSSGNRVHVSSPRGGRAFVYSLTGAAVKVFDAAPGVTVSETLPAGIWIVVFDGQRRKAVVGE